MNTTRRGFMQLLGAMGLTIATPTQAATEWLPGSAEQALGRLARPQGGHYYLIKLPMHHLRVAPVFRNVPRAEVMAVVNEFGIVEYGLNKPEYVWLKVVAFKSVVPFFDQEDDLNREYKETWVPAGGATIRFAAQILLKCSDGKVDMVSKYREGRLDVIPDHPQELHTIQTAMLVPFSGLGSFPAVGRLEHTFG